ncbi:MAG: hypothetical protein U1F25_06535 [Rubrivivax sp.]
MHGAEEVEDFDDAARISGAVCANARWLMPALAKSQSMAEVRHRARDGRLAGGAVGDVAAKGEQVAAVPREFSR